MRQPLSPLPRALWAGVLGAELPLLQHSASLGLDSAGLPRSWDPQAQQVDVGNEYMRESGRAQKLQPRVLFFYLFTRFFKMLLKLLKNTSLKKTI